MSEQKKPKSNNNLSNFIAQTKKSFVRQSNFEVTILPPNFLALSGSDFRKLSFKASSVNTPSTQLSTADDYVEVNEYRKYAYDYNRGIVAVSFYIDSNYDTVSIFDDWKNRIFSPKTRAVSFYNNYVATMFIDVLAKDNSIIKKYKFEEVFPKAINEINYDWSQQQTSVVLVTFEYASYELLDAEEDESAEMNRLENESKLQNEISAFKERNSILDVEVIPAVGGDEEILPETTGGGGLGKDALDQEVAEKVEKLSDGGRDLVETAVASAKNLEDDITANTDNNGVLSDEKANELAGGEKEIDTMKTVTNATVASTTAMDAAAVSIKEKEAREAAKDLSAGVNAATATASNAMKSVTSNIQDFENKIGNAIGTVAGAIKNFETNTKNIDARLSTVVNGLQTVEKLANVLGTAKSIQKNFENIKSLSKAIRAKNGFAAITAAKATISSISAMGRSTSQLLNQVKAGGELVALGVRTIDGLVQAQTERSREAKELAQREYEEQLADKVGEELRKVRQETKIDPVILPDVNATEPPKATKDAAVEITFDQNNRVIDNVSDEVLVDVTKVLDAHLSNKATVAEVAELTKEAYTPDGSRDELVPIPLMVPKCSPFVCGGTGVVAIDNIPR